MKKLLFLLLSLTALIGYGQQKITVTVDNATSDTGKIFFALHNKNTFMKAEAVKEAKSNIEKGVAQVVFDRVAPGTYALLCYHDANENNKMDFQTNGMPLEAYGASNNEMSMGPPSWDTCKFEVADEPLAVTIRF